MRQPNLLILADLIAAHAQAEPDFDVLESVASRNQIETFRQLVVDMPPVGISSTDIRGRITAGQSVRYQTPQSVVEYINEQGLYQAP